MLNELEMKYYLKDLEQRVQRSKSSAAGQTTCGACTWVRSLWQVARSWLAPSTSGPAITADPGHDAT
jgi:hypothetical protein